jgi:hypothetical protein
METENMSEKDRLRKEILDQRDRYNALEANVVTAIAEAFDGNEDEGIALLEAIGIPEDKWGNFGLTEYEVMVVLTVTVDVEVPQTVKAKRNASSSDIADALDEDGFDPDAEASGYGEVDLRDGEVTSTDWEIGDYHEA